MFDITADDIARLNDEQLRTVIARLCEAEVRALGYSAVHVTWGGNQNAADGGIESGLPYRPVPSFMDTCLAQPPAIR